LRSRSRSDCAAISAAIPAAIPQELQELRNHYAAIAQRLPNDRAADSVAIPGSTLQEFYRDSGVNPQQSRSDCNRLRSDSADPQ
jgi:hypothetical protein